MDSRLAGLSFLLTLGWVAVVLAIMWQSTDQCRRSNNQARRVAA